MPPRPTWWRILTESRRQACVAVDFSTARRPPGSYHDPEMHMHTGLAGLASRGVRARQGRLHPRGLPRARAEDQKGGDKKFWDLECCVKESLWPDDRMGSNCRPT